MTRFLLARARSVMGNRMPELERPQIWRLSREAIGDVRESDAGINRRPRGIEREVEGVGIVELRRRGRVCRLQVLEDAEVHHEAVRLAAGRLAEFIERLRL